MRPAIWSIVVVLAVFPWWAIPVTAWLVPLTWDESARVVTATVAAIWTPFFLLAAMVIAKATGSAS
jgi:hypothetical protein